LTPSSAIPDGLLTRLISILQLRKTAELFNVNVAAYCLMPTHYYLYNQFMAQQQDEDVTRLFELKKQPSMLGSKEFISWVKDGFFQKKICG